jgi:DMSO/TMAO reductase YedYZ heme-binding membrane subunit
MYAMVVVTVSSWVRKFLPTRLWRDIHLLAIPAFILALLHGVFSGTDTDRPAMLALYVASGLFVLFLVLVRGLTVGFRPPRPSAPDRAEPVEAPHGSPVAS